MKPLPDHLRKGLDIVFVGFNPSIISGETGHHFANPTNRFWKILHMAGLTPRKYSPAEDASLMDLGFGLTNIVERPTRAAADITEHEYQEGRRSLLEKLSYYRPNIICFVGKGVYQKYSGRRDAQWGKQAHPVIPGIVDFVAPSSSGLVRMRLDRVTQIYAELKEKGLSPGQ